MSPEEERELMRRIVSGDKGAFRTVVNAYMSDIYRFACSIVGDAAKGEDIAQEACVRLWTRADKWAATGPLKNWLFSITHNLCMDYLRGVKIHQPLEDIEFMVRDPANDPHQSMEEKEHSHIVRQALLSLPERQRTALMLVYYSGFSNPEAARVMEVSVDAFESLLVRGRTGLRELLKSRRKTLLGS
jgi:RNA polymerase sigma-70 factor (ECF subfamily)